MTGQNSNHLDRFRELRHGLCRLDYRTSELTEDLEAPLRDERPTAERIVEILEEDALESYGQDFNEFLQELKGIEVIDLYRRLSESIDSGEGLEHDLNLAVEYSEEIGELAENYSFSDFIYSYG